MKNKSNKKMLLLSTIGIIMVVSGHTQNSINVLGDIFPYGSFHMALFIFISGYFYKIENENNIIGKEWKKGYILKQIKKLLIPYFIWNLVYGMLGMILRNFNIINFGSDINLQTFFIEPWETSHQYIFNIASWFLLSLFLVKIFYVILRKLMTKCKLWNDNVMLVIFLIITFFSAYLGNMTIINSLAILKVGFFCFFYHLGFYYKTNIEGKHKINNALFIVIIIVIQLCVLKLSGEIITYTVWNMEFNQDGLIGSIIASVTGIFFWLKIAEILEPALKDSKTVNYIGNNTNTIMLHHLFFMFLFNTIIYVLSGPLNISGFDVNEYKNNIYYLYTSGIPQAKIIYAIVGIAGPLISKYLSENIKDKLKLSLDRIKK